VAEKPSDNKASPDPRDSARAQDARERRGSHRVGDDQKSGQGSLSALSKMKMIERKRAQLRVSRDDD
jgi:hypothetical protein